MIADTQAEEQKELAQAQQAYQAQTNPAQQNVSKDNALIQGLEPIVKKENSLPDTASFDQQKQEWVKR